MLADNKREMARLATGMLRAALGRLAAVRHNARVHMGARMRMFECVAGTGMQQMPPAISLLCETARLGLSSNRR